MKSLFIMIIGSVRHGKTEVGRALASVLNTKFGDTSDIVYQNLALRLSKTTIAKALGTPPEEMLTLLRSSPKEQIRDVLIKTGDALCAQDPSILVCALEFIGCRIVAGCRRRIEFEFAKKELQRRGYDVIVWWVQRTPAPIYNGRDNNELSSRDADFVFENNYKSVQELYRAVYGIAQTMPF